MIDALYRELTILGFVGLVLMCFVRAGLMDVWSQALFGAHHAHEVSQAKALAEHHIKQHGAGADHKDAVHHAVSTVIDYGAATQERRRRLFAEAAAPFKAAARRLHGAELVEVFEEVHMVVFIVMCVFIVLVFFLLVATAQTKQKFAEGERLRQSDVFTECKNEEARSIPSQAALRHYYLPSRQAHVLPGRHG